MKLGGYQQKKIKIFYYTLIYNNQSCLYQISLMKHLFILLVLVGLCQSKLVYLAELFRHGARYPVTEIYDGKETRNMHGNLTSIGMRQHYLLGTYLRRDYVEQNQLISGVLNAKEIEVFADEREGSERCIESAFAHLAGLFPLGQGERIPQGISPGLLNPPFETTSSSLTHEENLQVGEFALNKGFQPVPVKDGKDFFPHCKNEPLIIAKRLQAIAEKSGALQLQQAVFSERMALLFGMSPILGNIGGMIQLYDTVICDLNLGRPMPSKFTEKQFLELKFIQNYMFVLLYAQEFARVISTPVAGAVIDNMERIISGKEVNKKLSIYSGHDTNVAPMLTFLNITNADCVMKKYRNQTVVGNCAEPVPFASSIQFELHRRDNGVEGGASAYFVKVKYNGDYYLLCDSNSYECDFNDFASRIRAQLVDFDKECGNK